MGFGHSVKKLHFCRARFGFLEWKTIKYREKKRKRRGREIKSKTYKLVYCIHTVEVKVMIIRSNFRMTIAIRFYFY